MMTQLLEQLINGIISGAAYALVSLGLTLTYGVLGIVNFAHGELYMVGAYLSFFLVVTFHVNYFLTVAVVFGAGLILGSVVNQIVFRPLKTREKLGRAQGGE